MKKQIDMDKIAKKLGAERRGEVPATSGYFGAVQLAADIEARFRPPAKGGRPTDPNWKVKRLVGLSTDTFDRLQRFTRKINTREPIHIGPMQVAALLLEHAIRNVTDYDLEILAMSRFEDKKSVKLHCSESASSTSSTTKSASRLKSARK